MKGKSISFWFMLLLISSLFCLYAYFSFLVPKLDRLLVEYRERAHQRDYSKTTEIWTWWELGKYELEGQQKLERSLSRVDFPVRSGPRFACYRLADATDLDMRLGIYAPPGLHRLCYATLEIERGQVSIIFDEQFLLKDTSNLKKLASRKRKLRVESSPNYR